MMKSLLSASAVALLASAGLAPVAAQDTPEYTQETPAEEMAPAVDSSQFIGKSVYDATGQEVGLVEEIVTAADGSEQAVVSVGGFLGIGAKKITVSTSDLTANADGTGYSISLTADEIEAAPAYETETGAEEEPM
jgi:sporulation protein YlmC with PRC-barrel domain